ncbi:MAG: GNAT family N-acetyltransferase [Pseudomonadota bacterium]|nr:GNAT family N-acetyltransferase [Pseudomonadota bacterium]
MSTSIRQLVLADTSSIEAHLLRLSPADRSLRFTAGVVTDESIRRYVAGIRFGSDAVIGAVDAAGDVVALAHGGIYSVGLDRRVEVAFSVDADRRGGGLGKALLEAARRFAAMIGAQSVVAICMARNLPMRRVFAGAGMTMRRDDDEVYASCAPMPRVVDALSQARP